MAAVVVLAIVVVGAIDHGQTQATDLADCHPDDPACWDAQRHEIDRRERGFGRRAWLYALGALLPVAVATLLGLGSAPSAALRRREFAKLGAAGVLALVGALVLLIHLASAGTEYPGRDVIFIAPSICMLAVAAIGSVVTRSVARPAPHGAAGERRLPALSRVALGLAALALVLAILWAVLRGNCGTQPLGAVRIVRDGIFYVALVSAFGAGVSSLAGLVRGRWVVAVSVVAIVAVASLIVIHGSCLD